MASLVADIEEGRFEVGMAGWEGLVGVPLLLGVGHTPHTAIIQGSGVGHRISAENMRTGWIKAHAALDLAALRPHVHGASQPNSLRERGLWRGGTAGALDSDDP